MSNKTTDMTPAQLMEQEMFHEWKLKTKVTMPDIGSKIRIKIEDEWGQEEVVTVTVVGRGATVLCKKEGSLDMAYGLMVKDSAEFESTIWTDRFVSKA